MGLLPWQKHNNNEIMAIVFIFDRYENDWVWLLYWVYMYFMSVCVQTRKKRPEKNSAEYLWIVQKKQDTKQNQRKFDCIFRSRQKKTYDSFFPGWLWFHGACNLIGTLNEQTINKDWDRRKIKWAYNTHTSDCKYAAMKFSAFAVLNTHRRNIQFPS